jgi:HKD family nuclease
MVIIDFIAQPMSRTALDAIDYILSNTQITTIQVAAAYITSRGVHDLVKRVDQAMGAAWTGVEKRWLTSFDYCRSEPLALDALASLPSSAVRVQDAQFCLARKGVPRIPFHPKAFLFENDDKFFVLAGSGNLSRSGLSKGIEAGLVLGTDRGGAGDPGAVATIEALRHWFTATWNGATPLDAALLHSYSGVFESAANLKDLVPTEDDVASGDTGRTGLSSKDLQKLRVCRQFWIDAGNITKNRGPQLPGNQLMMKRLSRVFFGFDSGMVPENTLLGNVSMRFNGGPLAAYSITYSDNQMDKLSLPIPGNGGPPSYDNEYLLFREETPMVFDLVIGTPADKALWAKKSKAIDGAFKMTSGREWGVF